jgi:hypothetical protein
MAEGPPACRGGTWWATVAGLLVFGVESYWGAWAGAVSNPVAFVAFVVQLVPPWPSTRRGQARSKGTDAPGVGPGLWDGG